MSVSLVLEGGGTRGAYTSGVLDVLLENGVEFPTVYGISAGACTALSYVSKQMRRNYDIFYNYIRDPRYMSVQNLQKTGDLFGFDFIFGDLSHTLLPFDYETFFNSDTDLRAGATDMATGRAVYFGKAEFDEALTPVRASSSLPFLSGIVRYKGCELLDGGCAEPIPLERAIADGHKRNVVVLTRDGGYRKESRTAFPRAVLRAKYWDYPCFVDTMMNRGDVYNSELELCRNQERAGAAVVVRPSHPLVLSRYEKDPQRLKAVYELGAEDCLLKLADIKALLAQE